MQPHAAPNFMHYKALEMIEEGDFDDDMAVRGHFKRILWKEMMTEGEAEDERKQLQLTQSFNTPSLCFKPMKKSFKN